MPFRLIFNILKNIGTQVIKLIGVRALCASLKVLVKLAKAIEGTKTIKGILKENNETSITVEGTEEIIIPKDKIKSVNLEGEI